MAIPDWTVHEVDAQVIVDNTLEQANEFEASEQMAEAARMAAAG